MRHAIKAASILAAALSATTFVGCTASPTQGQHAASPSTVGTLRASVESKGSLSNAEVTELFKTDEGRASLAILADEFDHIFYDGSDRFVQLNEGISFYYGKRVPMMSLHNGWMHPDYAVTQSIRLPGISIEDNFEIEFQPETLNLTMNAPEGDQKSFSIAWAPKSTAQSGDINYLTGEKVLRP